MKDWKTAGDVKPKILIVDDERMNINALHGLLRNDYQVMAAISGEQALKAAISGMPDLILLDITMPDMDGLEVCQRLKNDPLTQEIPVIFITGLTHEEDEVKGFGAGAVDYIPKPFNPVIVQARVRTHARLKLQNDYLRGMAYRDGLTGVSNRRHFEGWADQELMRCSRLCLPVSVIMIDIDHFKLFNDHYGHQQGDTCLKIVAQSLHEMAEISKSAMVARYGGEEFVAFIGGLDFNDLKTSMEQWVEKVRGCAVPHAQSQTLDCVTISLGAVHCVQPQPGLLPELVRQADLQLYQSKSTGRNRASVTAFSLGVQG